MVWFRIETELPQSQCSKCSKTSSEYYELVLQLRFLYTNEDDQVKQDVLDYVLSKTELVNKVEEVDSGFDLYIGDSSQGGKISSEIKKRYFVEEKKSKTLVGFDFLRYKRNYKFTHNLTIINLKEGDKLSFKGDEYVIENLSNKDGLTLKEKSGRKRTLSFSKIKDYIRF